MTYSSVKHDNRKRLQIASGELVEVNGQSITFGVGNTNSTVTNGQVRITNIEVIYS